MMNLRISDIAKYLSITFNGVDYSINKIAIDSREVTEGDVFIAIPGQTYNGHEFIINAIDNGAKCIIHDKSYYINESQITTIGVDNTIVALGVIARKYKNKIGSPYTIGITGTNGKTTVTKLCESILKVSFKTSTTIGNYNNEIGLPLSILNAPQDTNKCIYEHGASKLGDIEYLTSISEPNLTTLLNVSEAHMESFINMNNLIKTKQEIFSHLNTSKVILNLDDKYFKQWKKINSNKNVVTISLNNDADYVLKPYSEHAYEISVYENTFILNNKNIENILPINILFSIAVSMESGASISDVTKGLESFPGIKGRFYKFFSDNKSMVIDDSYNANPESMKSALKKFAQINREKLFVMGDMGELGMSSHDSHLMIFELSKKLGVKYLFYMGKYIKDAKSIYGENCYTSKDMDELVTHIKNISNSKSAILIKASRFMNFDLIVKELE
jgi:UDP-N-acetylmuramoyl-tripeptide--D-alanyl-D-alanine ligase